MTNLTMPVENQSDKESPPFKLPPIPEQADW